MTQSCDRTVQPIRSLSEEMGRGLALCLGFATFLPIGINYLLLLGFGLLCLSPTWRRSRASLDSHWRWLLWLLLAWPGMVWLAHGTGLDALPRWAHSARLVACLALALTLPLHERKALLAGFLLGAIWTAGVVLVHHQLMPLPEWAIWHTLLSVKGNASSQKWILLATASGMGVWLAWQWLDTRWQRTALLALALLWGALVATYAVSRNAHLVLLLMPWLLLAYRYRQPRAWLLGGLLACGAGVLLWQWSPTMASRFNAGLGELGALALEGDFSGSVSVRAQMVWTAWAQMWQHPFIGTGLGSWAEIWAEASQRHPDMAGVNNPHNDYALWGMETGLPGLMLLVLMQVKMLHQAWQRPTTIWRGAGWLTTCALCLTAAVNAPYRDAALGMSLLILATSLSTWPTEPDNDSS